MVSSSSEYFGRAIDDHHPLKVVCIGAGFSGILCGIRLAQRIPNVDLTIYDKNTDIGGTWFENRYPGVGCDVPSHAYQFTFAPNPNWSKFYSGGSEIHEYLKDVAWRYDVDKYVRLEHAFQRADWDEKSHKWTIILRDLKTNRIIVDTADIFIRATGLLNKWKWPEINGLHSFKGRVMHTANFEPNYDLTGKNVALIGAGSTGIQVLPNIQPRAKRVFHYMKGKTWISPAGYAADFAGGKNFDYPPEQRQLFSGNQDEYLDYRRKLEEVMNKSQLVSFRGTKVLSEFWEQADMFMKEKLKAKPWIYEALRPSFPPGCRRLTPGPGYLEALLEDNVEFIGTGITQVTEKGILDNNGGFHDVDVIICATGFDYSFSTKDTPIFGRNGITLDEMYQPFPQAYLGITVPNMPNYFMFLGPASAPAAGSFIPSLETMMEYIVKCIKKLQREEYASLEPTQEALDAFNKQMDTYFEKTIYTYNCNSFFKTSSDARVSVLWPGSATHMIKAMDEPRWEDYHFVSRNGDDAGARFAWLGNGLTRAQIDGTGRSPFLENIDVPPVINHGPRLRRAPLADAVATTGEVLDLGLQVNVEQSLEKRLANL